MRNRGYKVFKLFLCLLLIFFIVIGPYYLVTYRPHDVDYNKENDEPQWTGVISFWDYPRLDQKTGTNFGWIYEKIRAFERANPGVYINFKPLNWEKGPIQVDTAVKMGNLPDIVPIGSDYSIISRDVLEPLDQYLTVDEIKDFRENALKSVKYDSKIYGVPWMMTTYTMVLNLDLFSERGVMPPENGDWTYEEFVDKMQALTFDSKGNNKIDHYGFNSFIQPGYYNVWGILLSDGAKVFNQKMQYSFNDDKALSGVQKLIDLKTQYSIVHPDFGVNNSNKSWTNFYKDKNIAAYPVGTWSLNVLDGLQKEGTGFNYAIAKFPSGKLGKSVTLSNMIGSYGMSKQEDRQKAEIIVKFLKFLVKDEYQQDLTRLGVFPARKSIGNIYADDPNMTMIYEDLENANIIFDHPYWKEIDEILQREIQQGVIGNKSAEEVLRDAEEKVTILLNSLGN
ncbi:extracellular solute-binding protein [Alkaliphilus sp. MSJ-5]|uniref:Extracellular solute-binding protein n=1 Tax=Alkaliphilus flagellatus TaxID=2841507 RepID=A0ABS6G102_9FIRM|nr:extracellular solute-binding protein [Alkaliphilus flagellatus]MBU5675016.1 extracellular solute-binding protein [Alkaliphilus flagellatus]